MRLCFLGTGGYHPNERRHTACVLLPELGIALDAGTGFFRVQQRLKADILDVFLSHAHLDHVCGLTFFLVPLLRGDVSRMRVHATEETLCAVKEHLFASELFPVQPPFEWVSLTCDSQVALPQSGTLRIVRLEHPGGSIGFRLDWPDRSLAYITDTTAPGTYQDFIRGVDVLIHECYFPDELADWAEKTGHSHATAVAELAKACQVGRLFLVHADPQHPEDDPIGIENIRRIFPNAVLAEDLLEIDF
ncbi:MAG: metal-dependent hydrolase [Planctomycetaceae bacterium]|nr:metal-dependent hydrolase [Planctomycetaceae bacterium]